MKKLMIALAVVACAAAVQASNYNWKMAKGQVYQAGSTTDKVAAGAKAYLFNSGTYSQTDLVKALFIDKTLTIANIGTKAIAGSETAVNASATVALSSDFTYNAVPVDSTWNPYYVIIDGDNVFVSSSGDAVTASGLEQAVGITQFTNPKTASQAAAMDGSKGYSTMGWYTAVPEPTSGLLLLLGVAGLALRRRRA